MKQTLGKAEKLKSRKLIAELFSAGKSVKAYPLVAVYLPLAAADKNTLMGVSVAKKRIKKAVDRNLVKRRLREAFRLHKAGLHQEEGPELAIMIIYLKGEIAPYSEVEKSMKKLLIKLQEAKKAI